MINRKRSKAVAIMVSFIVMLVLVGAGYYYALGTPQYSLYVLSKAFKNHDSETAREFIDIDRVVDKLIGDATEQLKDDLEKESQEAGEFAQFGQSIAEMIMPGLIEQAKETIMSGFLESIEDISQQGLESKVTNAKIKKTSINGKTAEVVLEIDSDTISVKMIQLKNRRWKIVEISTDDLMKVTGE